MTIHDITRLIVLLADKSTAQEFSWAVLLFEWQKSFLPEPAFVRNQDGLEKHREIPAGEEKGQGKTD